MEQPLRGKRFIVRYGQGGHEFEHCVNIEGWPGIFGGNVAIPQDVATMLSEIIGAEVMNRGSRLEIMIPEDEQDRIILALAAMGGTYDPTGRFLW